MVFIAMGSGAGILQVVLKSLRIDRQLVDAGEARLEIGLHDHRKADVVRFVQMAAVIRVKMLHAFAAGQVDAAVAGAFRRTAAHLHPGILEPVLVAAQAPADMKIIQFFPFHGMVPPCSAQRNLDDFRHLGQAVLNLRRDVMPPCAR
jgi:hypothetical protein